ncbi:MAG: alanine--tRNA ligase [Cytophagaceae bacterium]|jgi:alanyl-tRNA synthetase|nr:alanine--tRNA ligase [Cytophagaceae bacterium]
MTAAEIRQKYLDFFKSKGHQIVPSAPIVNKNDPTLMFTNAGMNQFKDYFLGNESPKYKRVADTQKCLRVSGKHNDLEEVGLDTYHHTMFEMLGNWSFGDYFKKEAIAWSWELLTKEYGLPKDRLYVTVFEGDAKEKIEKDNEAYSYWKEWIAEDRILMGNKKDNFWEMGDQGPCGPCTEIHIDLRSEEEVQKVPGKELVNMGDPRVVEIWNNVFIQFNRKADGSLEELPAKHVDTGMGFERLCMAVQGKQSNYDTDVFTPLIHFIATSSGKVYGTSEKIDIAMRVIADHIRAISFVIADGQLPSNVKAGYVIRRILRRAVRYGYTFLGFKEPFLYQLVAVLANQMAHVFPELKQQEAFVSKVIQEEEIAFLRTLDNGLKRLESIKEELTGVSKVISGKAVFELYDTYGFPVDLTALIARDYQLEIDEAGFEAEMSKQRERSKKAANVETGDWVMVKEEEQIDFIGYDTLESNVHIVKYRQVQTKNKQQYQLVLDVTPFYAESGGQVGDTGYLTQNGTQIPVLDTKKENNLIVHWVEQLPMDLNKPMLAQVNVDRRKSIQRHHSATHLLHAALKQVLGNHVNQKGSFVSDTVLRFDFSHFSKVTEEEIRRIEKIVNEKIRATISLDEKRNIPIEQAKQLGATALFGEKYGEFVRVITFDEHFSRELCGGTHVQSTGEIGYIKITSESSVAAGVRRLEAVCGAAAESVIIEQETVLNQIKELVKSPGDVLKSIQDLIDERNSLLKEMELVSVEKTQHAKDHLKNLVETIGDIQLIQAKISLPSTDAIRQISFELKQLYPNLFLVLAVEVKGKPNIAVMLSDTLVGKGLNAVTMVKELAKDIQGGGGGQPFFATAGGKELQGLDVVLTKVKNLLPVNV